MMVVWMNPPGPSAGSHPRHRRQRPNRCRARSDRRRAEAAAGRRPARDRAAHEALIERLEDLEDPLELAKFRADEQTRGAAAVRADCLSGALVNRLRAGEHPVRIWREHRGLTGSALAVKVGVPASYLCEIEGRRKPGSVSAYRRLATALGITLDDLVPADVAEGAGGKGLINALSRKLLTR